MAINDNFNNAISLSGLIVETTGTNIGATRELGEPLHGSPLAAPTNSVWWEWTALSSGDVTISTIGSNFDTTLAVYTGTLISLLTTIASNDDFGASTNSSVSFTSIGGQTYRIAVDGYAAAVGNINLAISLLNPRAGDGDDSLFGEAGNDTLNGGLGNDSLFGEAGNDSLFGEDGNDFLAAGAGNDFVRGGLGNDNIFGGDGGDGLNGEDGDDSLFGEAGNDGLSGGNGNDNLNGGDGNDNIGGFNGNDNINGGAGIDTVIESGDVNFTLTNTSLTGRGTDTLISIESATLTGGVGNNTLNAIAFTLGSVILNGDAGNDLLIGGSQNDILRGGDGDDTLAAKAGNDRVEGGNGIDIVTERADVNFTLTNTTLTGLGTDSLVSIESSVLTGGVGNNSFNALAFTLGSVTQNGDAGNDVLRGGFKNDFLNGGVGNDVLRGAGNNNGVGSIDTLTGNAGNDTFILSDSTTAFYNDGNNANAGLGDYALIKDFSSSVDKIQLEGAANRYLLGTSPLHGGASGTAIYLDTNGNKAFNSTDELIAIVQGSGGLNLASSYFVYV